MMISQPEQDSRTRLMRSPPRSTAGARSCNSAVPASQQLRSDRIATARAPAVGKQRSTERLVRRLFDAVESGSTSAIWDFFARDGAIEFPFVGSRYTDFASFDAAIGPLLAVLPGLTFTDPDFQFLDDPEALIAKYKGHAIVTFTGKAYDQTYITEIHTRNGKVTYYAEYFDTAVLNAAFTHDHGDRAPRRCSRSAVTQDEHDAMTVPSELARHAPIIKIEEPGRQPLLVVVAHPIEIGRECSGIVLTDLAISRKHLLAVSHGNTVRITDLGTTNGSTLDGDTLEPNHLLRSGDVVEFGACTLRLVAEGSAETDVAEAATGATSGAESTIHSLSRRRSTSSPMRS